MGSGASICGCISSYGNKKQELSLNTSPPNNLSLEGSSPTNTPRSSSYVVGDDACEEEDYSSTTPVKPNDKRLYKYYCPMCFVWWKDGAKHVLTTTCCGNNICVPCARDYLDSKGVEVRSKEDIMAHVNSAVFLHSLSCPTCGSDGFRPALTLPDVDPRNYFQSPTPSPEKTPMNLNATCTPNKGGPSVVMASAVLSPVKMELPCEEEPEIKDKEGEQEGECVERAAPLGNMSEGEGEGIVLVKDVGPIQEVLHSFAVRYVEGIICSGPFFAVE